MAARLFVGVACTTQPLPMAWSDFVPSGKGKHPLDDEPSPAFSRKTWRDGKIQAPKPPSPLVVSRKRRVYQTMLPIPRPASMLLGEFVKKYDDRPASTLLRIWRAGEARQVSIQLERRTGAAGLGSTSGRSSCFLPWTCAVRGEKAWPLARQVAGQSQEETKQFDFSPWIRASFRAAPRLLTATGTGRLHYNNADPYSDRR
jgi:hypothetical protein